MKQTLLAYAIFVIVLISSILIFPQAALSDIFGVCLAVICVIKFIQKLSLLILSVIVIVTTIVFPILMLSWITKHSVLSVLSHFIPNSFDNLQKLANLLLPTFVLIVLVTWVRFWRHRKSLNKM